MRCRPDHEVLWPVQRSFSLPNENDNNPSDLIRMMNTLLRLTNGGMDTCVVVHLDDFLIHANVRGSLEPHCVSVLATTEGRF